MIFSLKMIKKAFIDTNVLVGYLILSGIEKTKKTEEEKKELWKQYKKIKSAYDFICKLKENKKIKFITSNLATIEIINSLFNEYICRKMWKDGLPLSSWSGKKKHYSTLERLDLENLKEDIEELNKIENLRIIKEKYDIELISKLIFEYGLKTQDSILFSNAIKNKCNFFITRDEQDLLNNNRLKECFNEIKLISPEQAIKEFFS